MLTYQIDCREVESIQDLIEAFNKGLIEKVGGKWNGGLDALSDYLSWPDQCPYTLTILGQAQCAKVFDSKANEGCGQHFWASIKGVLSDNSEWVHVEFK